MNNGIKIIILKYIVLSSLIFFFAADLYSDEISFEDRWSNKELLIDIPVSLEVKEIEDIKKGKLVQRIINSDYEIPAVWMIFIVEADPITVWWIWNDLDHFSLEDPSYPKSGSLFNKRNIFWPHILDSYTCNVNKVLYQYQLLAFPLASPRKTMLRVNQDQLSFPWQKLEIVSDKFYCGEKKNSEFDKLESTAIATRKGETLSLIGPLSEALSKESKNILRTQVIYYILGNPGGTIGKLMPLFGNIESISKSIVGPESAKAIRFHASNWEEHMIKYHTPEENAEYNELVNRYLEYYKE